MKSKEWIKYMRSLLYVENTNILRSTIRRNRNKGIGINNNIDTFCECCLKPMTVNTKTKRVCFDCKIYHKKVKQLSK